MRSRIRRIRRTLQIGAAIAIAALVGLPDVVFAAKSLDQMSQQELDSVVKQLNETANWRKYRRPSDPPDFVPGKPVKVMHGAGTSMGRARHGGGNFRRGGLASRRASKSSRGNRNDTMAQNRGSSRSNSSRSNSNSSSSSRNSGFGSSSRSSGFGSSSRGSGGSSFGSGGSSFGSGGNNSFGE
jgi:hypothetical protein